LKKLAVYSFLMINSYFEVIGEVCLEAAEEVIGISYP